MSDMSGAIVKRDDEDQPGAPTVAPAQQPKKSKSRRNNNTIKNRPAFVSKLWSMVNDPENHEHIRWAPDDESFQVIGREQFEKEVLPKYFKHSNFASFVRQLNMYGWHKVQDVNSGAMQQSTEEVWQFKSPNFKRGREDLLDNIVRNKTSKNGSDDEHEHVDMQHIFNELAQIRENQNMITQDLMRIRKDNQLLWHENIQSRERHQKHADTLDKIMRFLASLYGGNNKLLADLLVNNNNQNLRGSVRRLLENGQVPGVDGEKQLQQLMQDYDEESPARKQRRIESVSSDGNEKLQLVRTPGGNNLTTPARARAQSFPFPQQDEHPQISRVTKSPSQSATPASNDSNGLETPGALFPELKDSAANDDKVAQELQQRGADLNNLNRHLNEQGNSLAQVEQWLSQTNPTYTYDTFENQDFNVDDYLNPTTFDETPAVTGASIAGPNPVTANPTLSAPSPVVTAPSPMNQYGYSSTGMYPATTAGPQMMPDYTNGSTTVPYNPTLEPITDTGEIDEVESDSLKRRRKD